MTVIEADAPSPEPPDSPAPHVAPVDPRRATRTQRDWLFAIGGLALAIRVAFVLRARRKSTLQGDDFTSHWGANDLANCQALPVPQ